MMVGPITVKERIGRIQKFWKKRRFRTRLIISHEVYHCRSVFATIRFRIKGRFLTNDQAAAVLGLTENQVKIHGRETVQHMLSTLQIDNQTVNEIIAKCKLNKLSS